MNASLNVSLSTNFENNLTDFANYFFVVLITVRSTVFRKER